MTRHSKNATNGPSYTYHEKQKDSKTSGYGSQDVRLSKDAIKEFDCCSLSLQPCKEPVITQDGYLYDKEAILEYILHQKRDNLKKLKQYEAQKNREKKDIQELADIASKQKLEKFLKTEGKLVTSTSSTDFVPTAAATSHTKAEANSSVSNMSGSNSSKLPSFWIPSMVPSSKTQEIIKKPDAKVYCPMSGRPLTMRDLFDVKFKMLDDKDSKAQSLIAKSERYVCDVTGDVLSNSVPCVYLKTSGSVVTAECFDKLIKKDMVDPINNKKMLDSDVIPFQRGGTGFAGSGVQLLSKKVTPAMIS